MKQLYLKTVLFGIILFPMIVNAQNSSGKCWYLDYDLWKQAEYPDVHGICPASDVLNPGAELTMEVWVRSYTFGLNMKILGRTTPEFNNGYILGFENMNVYSEIFNPDKQSVNNTSAGPMPPDSGWVHIATTYSATGKMINYVNGVEVSKADIFPQNPVTDSDEPFIIGRAPWDFAWAFNGSIDEIRIWNTQKTEAEIKALMFKELQGSEEGLLAYYNFNDTQNEKFFDNSENSNDGTINNYEQECFWWKDSYAPVGDDKMYEMHDVNAAWYGKGGEQFNYVVTQNGLSVLAKGIKEKEFWKYVVFGHDDKAGVSTEDAPQENLAGYQRLARTWYVNQANDKNSQLIFNLEAAANGGEMLAGGQNPENYTLLYRENETGNFSALFSANKVNGNYMIFDYIGLKNGYYTLCYTDQKIAEPAIKIESLALEKDIEVYPNPATNIINLKNAENTDLQIVTVVGGTVLQQKIKSKNEQINIDFLDKGVYLLIFSKEQKILTKKIIKK